MNDKRYAFVDRKCQKCNGNGSIGSCYKIMCPECQGTGMIGGYEKAPTTKISNPRFIPVLAYQLRKVREEREIGMDELAKIFGWSLVHLSDIETGRVQPTEAERQQIQEWIERG